MESSFKFPSVEITEDLFWALLVDTVVKKAHHGLLRRLRKFGKNTSIPSNFHRCTIKSLLTGCITI